MALIKVNYYSRALKRNTEVNVILPSDQPADEQTSGEIRFIREYPVLYLYHGVYGDNTDWLSYTRIIDYANEFQVAVVLPSLENHFGLKLAWGDDYATFLGEELPAYMENWLPITGDRARKWTGGLSMGGYVAWSIAMRYPDRFGRAISLSGALDLKAVVRMQLGGANGLPFDGNDYFGACMRRDENDLKCIYAAQSSGHAMPRLYQACGTEDFLYDVNTDMRGALTSLGADITYEEGPGAHEWPFWDKYVRRGLAWAFGWTD